MPKFIWGYISSYLAQNGKRSADSSSAEHRRCRPEDRIHRRRTNGPGPQPRFHSVRSLLRLNYVAPFALSSINSYFKDDYKRDMTPSVV